MSDWVEPKQEMSRVLVVDDEFLHASVLRRVLGVEGISVEWVGDGEHALAACRDRKPDLVLLDIVMPGVDGFEVLARMRRTPSLATIPVIMLTGIEEIGTKLQAFVQGAVDYIVKPFHPEEVRARVSLHLKLSMATAAMVQSQKERLGRLREASDRLRVRPGEHPGASFSVFQSTVEEAGGDVFEVFPTGEGQWGYAVADVSGHEMSASLAGAAFRALLRQNGSGPYSPVETLRLVNEALVGWLPPSIFLTAVFLRLHQGSGRLRWAGAGHLPPLLWDASSGTVRFFEAGGDVLGSFREPSFVVGEERIRPGDRLVMYTDGLVEDSNRGRTVSDGLQSLRNVMMEISREPLSELPDLIVGRLIHGDPADDVVVLVVECTGKDAGNPGESR